MRLTCRNHQDYGAVLREDELLPICRLSQEPGFTQCTEAAAFSSNVRLQKKYGGHPLEMSHVPRALELLRQQRP